MADMRNVIAAPGRLVRDPVTMKPIPGNGAGIAVDLDEPFWFRRWRDQDVIAAEPSEPASPPAPPALPSSGRKASDQSQAPAGGAGGSQE